MAIRLSALMTAIEGDDEACTRPLWDKTIRFRPKYFKMKEDEQARTFFHEMTHIYAKTKHNYGKLQDSPNDAHWLDQVMGSPKLLESMVRTIIIATQPELP